MGHVTTEEIRDALATGKKVWSRAIGRAGRITGTDGRTVELRLGRLGKGQAAVTWFYDGDPVKLIERDGEYFIVPDWSEG